MDHRVLVEHVVEIDHLGKSIRGDRGVQVLSDAKEVISSQLVEVHLGEAIQEGSW